MALTKVTGDFIKAGSITQGHLHSSHGITTSHIAEGDKLFFTNARVDSRVGSLSTSNLSEGTNLYYTNARARAAISGTGSLSYNSTTGVMSFTMPAQNTSNITEGSNLYYTDARADARVALIVDSAPGTLNTLNELAAALGDDANFSTTVTNSIATKLPLAGGTLTGALQAQPWLFRSMANQTEYHVLDNGSLNGPSWKFRYDGATANRYVDFGYKDGNGTYYAGLKLYNNQTVSWRGTDIINASGQWTGGIASSGYNNSNWDTAYGWGDHGAAGYLASSSYTASDILTKIKTVDGSGSGLDADLLDGQHASSFWTKSGSWYGDLGSHSYTREIGLAMTGGSEFVVLSKSGQGSVLVDGHYMAYESANGFFGSFNSTYGNLTGIRATAANTLKVMQLDGGNAILEVTQDARAPIFYDIDNTAYYLNPASDTSMNTKGAWRCASSTWDGEFAGKMQYHSNYWYIQTTNGVFVRNASGANNVTLSANGVCTAANDWRAPQFYDSADTNYYLNPNGNSVLSTANFSTVQISAGSSYNENIRMFPGSNGYSSLILGAVAGSSGTGTGQWTLVRFPNANSNKFTIRHNSTDHVTIATSGSVTNHVDTRSPIFYDLNNTGYYVNPDTGSNLKGVTTNTTSNSTGSSLQVYTTTNHQYPQIYSNGSFEAMWNYKNSAAEWYVGIRTSSQLLGTSGFHFYNTTSGQTVGGWNINGHSYSIGSSRAPIFYDSDSTAHYVHPGNLSNLSGLNVEYGNMDLRYSNTVDMTGSSYNQSTYYPVRIYVSDITRIRIENRLNAGGTHPGWASHGSGFSLLMDWHTNGSGWGTVGVSRTIRQWNEAWANVTICGGISQMSNSSAEIVYLRGGGKYLIKTSFNNTVQVSSSSHTANGQTVSPTTSIVNDVYSSSSGIFSAGNIYSNNFYDAADPGYLLSPANTGVSLKVKGTAEFVTAAGNLRGYIRATDTNDSHFIIATSGGEDIAFKDGGTSGGVNMVIRGDGDVIITRNLYTRSFYDQDNTGYYVDPASTSNMNAATFAGNVIGQNAYFNQDVGIGFTSGNIGGNLNIRNSAAGQIAAKIELGSSVNSSSTGVFVNTTASYASSGMFLHFQSNHISGDDNVLIAYLDGDIVNKNNSYTQYSDQRLKENIVDATSKLEEIKQIRVRNFNFIGEDLKQIGVVAQELEPIFPSLVKEREVPGHDDPIKTVKYSVMVPILIKAIQEQQTIIDDLKSRLETLENQ